ncbi:MAG: hypothetical protein Aureis2KO_05590 [Aureisphaera sp.]
MKFDSSNEAGLIGNIPVEGNSYSSTVFTPVKAGDHSIDTKIYPYEEVSVFIFGEANLSPYKYPKRRKKYVIFNETDIRWKDQFKKATEVPNLIELKIGSKYIGFDKQDVKFDRSSNTHYLAKTISVPANSSSFNKEDGLDIQTLVRDDELSIRKKATRLKSYTEYQIEVKINLERRLVKFQEFLNKTGTIPTSENISKWLDNRFISVYGPEVATLLTNSINQLPDDTMDESSKIQALEYISTKVSSNSDILNLSLGKLYQSNGEYLKCIGKLEQHVKKVTNIEDHMFNSILYSNSIAEAYETLALCYVNKDQGASESDINKAFAALNQSSKFYLLAQNLQKYFSTKIQQLRLLKKINDLASLQNANNYVNEYISNWEGKGNNTGIGDIEVIPLDLKKCITFTDENVELKITSRESLNEVLNRYKSFISVDNNILKIAADQIVLKEGTEIYLNEDLGLLGLEIQAKNIIIEDNVLVEYDAGTASHLNNVTPNNLSPLDKTDIEINANWNNTSKNRALSSTKQEAKGSPGSTGNSGESEKQFKIRLIGGINYLGNSGIRIYNNGQNGGNGGPGGQGRKFKYTLVRGSNNRTVMEDVGLQGNSGKGGNGGIGGIIEYDVYFIENDYQRANMQNLNRIELTVDPGKNGGLFGSDKPSDTKNDQMPGQRIEVISENMDEFYLKYFGVKSISLKELNSQT